MEWIIQKLKGYLLFIIKLKDNFCLNPPDPNLKNEKKKNDGKRFTFYKLDKTFDQ